MAVKNKEIKSRGETSLFVGRPKRYSAFERYLRRGLDFSIDTTNGSKMVQGEGVSDFVKERRHDIIMCAPTPFARPIIVIVQVNFTVSQL